MDVTSVECAFGVNWLNPIAGQEAIWLNPIAGQDLFMSVNSIAAEHKIRSNIW